MKKRKFTTNKFTKHLQTNLQHIYNLNLQHIYKYLFIYYTFFNYSDFNNIYSEILEPTNQFNFVSSLFFMLAAMIYFHF